MLGNSVWVYGPSSLGLYLILMVGATAFGSVLMCYWIRKTGLLFEEKANKE
jgi:hypothetical protein